VATEKSYVFAEKRIFCKKSIERRGMIPSPHGGSQKEEIELLRISRKRPQGGGIFGDGRLTSHKILEKTLGRNVLERVKFDYVRVCGLGNFFCDESGVSLKGVVDNQNVHTEHLVSEAKSEMELEETKKQTPRRMILEH